MRLSLLLLIIWIQSLECFNAPTKVNYAPFHLAIREALMTSAISGMVKPIRNTSTSLDCHMPQSSIMITLSNFFSIKEIAIQHKGMTLWNMKECLESRLITVCLDEACIKLCRDESIKNCVLLSIDVPESDWMEPGFRFLMVMKHWLIFEALKIVENVMFFDADVVLFRNPWIDTLYRRNEDGSLNMRKESAEYMYQPEMHFTLGCAGTPNGGQLYLRNTSRIQEYFKMFLVNVPKMLTDGGTDQDYMVPAMDAVQLNRCSLPQHRYTSHCHFMNTKINGPLNETARLNDIVSFHASCYWGIEAKLTGMLKVFKGLEEKNPTNLMKNFI